MTRTRQLDILEEYDDILNVIAWLAEQGEEIMLAAVRQVVNLRVEGLSAQFRVLWAGGARKVVDSAKGEKNGR